MSRLRTTTRRPPARPRPGRTAADAMPAAAPRERLARLVGRFAGARVLVVGDLMLDRFVRGDVWRISPEAPVPVVAVRSVDVHPGGAGNVVANLAALGAAPTVVGWVGRDGSGAELRGLLDGLGADARGVVAVPALSTIEKIRVVAHAQQVVRLDHEPGRPGPAVEREVLRRTARHLGAVDAVIVSDYGKGTIFPALLDRLAAARRSGGVPLLVDPKQANFAHYADATLVKPNAHEAEQASGVRIIDEASLARAGAALVERWRSEAVLLSRGEQGMSLFRSGVAPRHFRASAREVFDVTGAGDTVIAVAALALSRGGTPEEAAWLANVAAGVVVGKAGTATLGRRELVAAVEEALTAGAVPPGGEAAGRTRSVRGGRGAT